MKDENGAGSSQMKDLPRFTLSHEGAPEGNADAPEGNAGSRFMITAGWSPDTGGGSRRLRQILPEGIHTPGSRSCAAWAST